MTVNNGKECASNHARWWLATVNDWWWRWLYMATTIGQWWKTVGDSCYDTAILLFVVNILRSGNEFIWVWWLRDPPCGCCVKTSGCGGFRSCASAGSMITFPLSTITDWCLQPNEMNTRVKNGCAGSIGGINNTDNNKQHKSSLKVQCPPQVIQHSNQHWCFNYPFSKHTRLWVNINQLIIIIININNNHYSCN